MGIPFIDLKSQFRQIESTVRERMDAVLAHGRYVMGPEVTELEETLANYVGSKHAVSCSSGTDALLLALMARGIGPGDAVFTSPYTFVATAEVISLTGATPVFVDIDPKTFNIDVDQLELALKAFEQGDPSIHPLPVNHDELRARAVIPVDMFGLPAEYDRILKLTEARDLFLLEDAAQSFGGERNGKRTCSFGDAAATSFFPAKPLGCYGDGGMVFTDSDELCETIKSIRVHGEGDDKYDNRRIGLNARMDTLQAAILLAKFTCFPTEVEQRQAVAAAYARGLDGCVETPNVPEGSLSGWAQYTIRLGQHAPRRTEIQKELSAVGVPTAVYYGKPLHIQGAYSGLEYAPADFPHAMRASSEVLSLPFSPGLDEESIATVVRELMKAVGSVPTGATH
ncbi:MAG: UDP-2-acetamido-2-deoxy-ribo-hexuluronate aminotransferase [Planctomycetota bacterium]|jgi:UDP-2-acetamido-2-deoxy-ribo-hexuluronate aminotransferase